MKLNFTKEEPKKPNLVADIVGCFWISLILFYILFAVSMGQWNTYYWIGGGSIGFWIFGGHCHPFIIHYQIS